MLQVGASAVPAGGLAPRSRAVRASRLPALRPVCEVHRCSGEGNFPTKPGPGRTKGPYLPWAEPWWNAGRRARPIAEGRRKPLAPWCAPHPLGVALVAVRLPALRFLYFISFFLASSCGGEAY